MVVIPEWDIPVRDGGLGSPRPGISRFSDLQAHILVRVCVVCVGALLLAGGAAAQDGGKTISDTAIAKTTIRFGTATPGGGFPLYGNAFADVMNAADPTLSIEPRNTKGSNENIPLLEAGQIDIATVAGEPSYEAFMGIGRPRTHLKILTAMYSSPGMFVVRADSPYKTIRDLVGQPIAFGAKGSGLPILSRYVLDGLGLKQDEDFKSVYLDHAGDGPAMVLDKRVAALWGAGVGWPGFTAIATSSGGARFKTLHGAEATFCKKLAQACETTAANTVAAAPEPGLIHPGVVKYFREIGVVK
jgi:uncharacterized protein